MSIKELDYLFQIQSKVTPCLVELPNGEESYSIDLQTRKISSPEFLSVQRDHLSNVIYFNVDRFFDYMDLSTTSCVITYQTPDGQSHMYPIPYYDTYSLAKEGKMVLPWNISDIVTKQNGIITYSFRFFKLSGDTLDNSKLVYNLNTSPATSEILYTLDSLEINEDDEEANAAVETLETLISKVKNTIEDSFYWTIMI